MAVTRLSSSTQLAVDADFDVQSFKVTNVGEPTENTDAANKAYVDDKFYQLDSKNSVKAASAANVDISSAPATLDGITLSNTDRVLLKDQTDASENGIYVFAGSGSAMARSTDADTDAKVNSGMYTFVEEGTVNGDKGFAITTNNPITLDTTNLTFEQFTTPDDPISESNFIVRETPSGLVNGTNADFVLANVPVIGLEHVYLNGIMQEFGGENDYTVTGSTVTFTDAPESGDLIRVTYIKD